MKDENKMASSPRKPAALIFPVAIIICVAAYAIWTFMGRNSAVTDDAYVEGNIVQVTSQVSGTVTRIHADNTDYVYQGAALVNINPADAKIALDKAKAGLASTLRTVRNQFANAEQLKASIAVKQSDYDKAMADYRRRAGLSKSYAISAEDMDHASEALNSAKAALRVARSQYAAALTFIDNTTPETHPDVLTAEAAVREAWLDYHRTTVIAPVTGIIAQRSIQVGQHVDAGSALMSIIPLENIWVTANFKENQLANIRNGQPVELTSDVYGRKATFHGQILGIEPGTGSAFSLLPAQNATGNWIKVVQRVPVRIALRSDELKEHPLRIGLSMQVKVDTQQSGESPLKTLPEKTQQWSTPVYQDEGAQADVIIREIVAHNG